MGISEVVRILSDGEREDEMPVGDGADHLLPDELGPEGGSLGRTGGAKPSLLARKSVPGRARRNPVQPPV